MNRIVITLIIALVAFPAVALAAGQGADPGLKRFADPALLTGMLVMSLLLISWWQRIQQRALPTRPVFCPWTALDALLASAVFVLLLILLGAAAQACSAPGETTLMKSLVAPISGIITVTLILVVLHRRYGLWPRDLGLTFDRWPSALLLAAGLVVFLFALQAPMGQFFVYLHEHTHTPMKQQEVVERIRHASSWWEFGGYVFLAVVAAPLWEEIAFRGFLQPLFRSYLGAPTAIGVTAVVFALVHEPSSNFFMVPIMIFPVGLALSYAYERTQRLSTCIMLHMLFNGLPMGLVFLGRLLNSPVPGTQ